MNKRVPVVVGYEPKKKRKKSGKYLYTRDPHIL